MFVIPNEGVPSTAGEPTRAISKVYKILGVPRRVQTISSKKRGAFHASIGHFVILSSELWEVIVSPVEKKIHLRHLNHHRQHDIDYIIAPNIIRNNTHQLLPTWLCEQELRKENSSKHSDRQAKAMKLQHFTYHYRQLMNWEGGRNSLLSKMNSNLLSSDKWSVLKSYIQVIFCGLSRLYLGYKWTYINIDALYNH